ncbi:MAG: hypothetical protein G5663_04605 [Serratia symbiotica]|nr:hypothetical protein [Serratia symbiotica]
MEIFNLGHHPYVALCDLLKFQVLCERGGSSKPVIAIGRVKMAG